MSNLARPHSFPDYVICPHCGEPEVEVWCNVLTAHCHACGQTFSHARPALCVEQCDQDTCAIEPAHGPLQPD